MMVVGQSCNSSPSQSGKLFIPCHGKQYSLFIKASMELSQRCCGSFFQKLMTIKEGVRIVYGRTGDIIVTMWPEMQPRQTLFHLPTSPLCQNSSGFTTRCASCQRWCVQPTATFCIHKHSHIWAGVFIRDNWKYYFPVSVCCIVVSHASIWPWLWLRVPMTGVRAAAGLALPRLLSSQSLRSFPLSCSLAVK